MISEKTVPVVVKEIHRETSTILRYSLSPTDGQALLPYSAGSHIAVYLHTPNGVLRRHYSLIGDPDDNERYQIAVKLNEFSNGGSYYFHNHVKVGDKLHISFPKNHFPLSFRARHHLLYAGGIGITPFLSMMVELQKKGASYELHYAAKTKDECGFYHFLKRNYDANCHFYFSGEGNRITPITMADQLIGTHVYICGPEEMVESFTNASIQYGYPKNNIHIERFTAPVPFQRNTFTVGFSDRKSLIKVSENETLLDALLNNGLDIPYSCKVGRCGTCQLKVKDGEINHYDMVLSEEERKSNDSIIACVSRARSTHIILDRGDHDDTKTFSDD